jgi:hypothetical protein
METGRFILRYRGAGSIPANDLERINSLEEADVVDSTSRMLLIDAPPEELEQLVDSMPEWILVPERQVSIPDPRPKINKEFEN